MLFCNRETWKCCLSLNGRNTPQQCHVTSYSKQKPVRTLFRPRNKVQYSFSKKLGGFLHFFSTFWWYVWSFDFILKFLRLILQWETKYIISILCSTPYFKHFFEILGLSSPNIRQKYLFYTSCCFFFLKTIAEGICGRTKILTFQSWQIQNCTYNFVIFKIITHLLTLVITVRGRT